jgi:hypothetical protein
MPLATHAAAAWSRAVPVAEHVLAAWSGAVPLAGPVFTEWYWGPLFFGLVYGPPILAVAGVLHLLLRRTGWRRAQRAALALIAAPALVLGGLALKRTVEHRRTEAADARSVSFATFAARGFHQTRAEVHDTRLPSVHVTYERDGRTLFVSQHATRDDDVTPPDCAVHDGTRFSAWDGPCRAARTPAGRTVTLARTPDPSLLAVRDGTLIVAGSHEATEADLLALADALAPVDVADIGWER